MGVLNKGSTHNSHLLERGEYLETVSYPMT